MTTTTLIEMAERLERASGPDRMLDAEINVAFFGFPERAYYQACGMRPRGAPELDRMEWLSKWDVLRFTASLDAAVTLVPEGWEWLVRSPSKNGPNDKGRFFARLESPDFESVTWGKGDCWITDQLAGSEATSFAATPALALTAACLRARASKGGE